MTDEPRDECPQCGELMPAPARASGRQRVYCSDACRSAAYRARRPGPDQRRAELAAALDRLDQVGLRYLVDQVWDGVPYSAAATERALRQVEAARLAERDWKRRVIRDGADAATNAAADRQQTTTSADTVATTGRGAARDAGRRGPRNRSQAARQLAARLGADLGAQIELRWDSSTASAGRTGSWAWHVVWSNGPTVDQLRERVTAVIGKYPALQAEDLVYVRTVQPDAVLLAMIGHIRAGRPACGPYRHEVELERSLADVPYPERGTEEDLQLVARLSHLTGGGWRTGEAAELLNTHGLVLPDEPAAAHAAPADTESGSGRVVPFTTPARHRR